VSATSSTTSGPSAVGAHDGALLAALADAVWTPSAHNTQPWRFVVDGRTVHVRADRTRALPANDPHDRELTMSCGAAVTTLEVATAAQGWRARASLLPDAEDPDLFATVVVEPRDGEDERATAEDDLSALHAAVRTRHTYRGHFAPEALPEGLATRLVAAAARLGVDLVVLDRREVREDLASAVAVADRTQFGDPTWRRELAMWMHPDRDVDGMPLPAGSDLGTRLAPTAPGEPVEVEDPDRALVVGAPLLVVLATHGDRPRDWLEAGRALQRVLLTAATEGVQASYLNQACQVPAARNGVRYLIEDAAPGSARHPQAILRFGVPAREIRRTRRRPLEDVVTGS
jgi:hypothetical protein